MSGEQRLISNKQTSTRLLVTAVYASRMRDIVAYIGNAFNVVFVLHQKQIMEINTLH